MIFIKRNKIIIITTIILSIIGVIMIYSSSYIWASFKYGNAYKYFVSQFCFLIIGIVIILLMILALISIVRNKKKGKSFSCGGDCSHCSSHCGEDRNSWKFISLIISRILYHDTGVKSLLVIYILCILPYKDYRTGFCLRYLRMLWIRHKICCKLTCK